MMLGSPLHPQPPPDPERLLKGYRWPASRITKADMIRLTELRERTGRRITVLLHEAVVAYFSLLAESAEGCNDGPRCCENPALRWKSESASNCYIECLSCGFVLYDDGQLADWHDPEQIAWERESAMDGGMTDSPGESVQGLDSIGSRETVVCRDGLSRRLRLANTMQSVATPAFCAYIPLACFGHITY